jgi:thymidylate synthase
MFAQQSNMIPGKLIGDLSEVHLYNNHIKYAKEQLERDMFKYEAPTLKLNKAEDMFSYKYEDFIIENYNAYPNWVGKDKPPIAI